MSTTEWFWMMDYCKKKGLAPANHSNWLKARKAYKLEKGT